MRLPITADTRCPMPLLLSILLWRWNGRPAATVPLSPNRILISSTETGNHAAPARPPGVGRDGENESAPERRPFAGETGNGDVVPERNAPGLRSRARSRPAAAPGPERAGLACMLAATPPPTRRRAVARPFQGRVSRQRLKAPGLNADHCRRVRTDPSICSAPLRPKV